MIKVKEAILFYAFRYALGRSTYAVGDVVEELIKHKDILSDMTKGLIVKEIKEAIKEKKAGHGSDKVEWMGVANTLEN